MEKKLAGISILFLLAATLTATGCAPTYPKEKLVESVIQLCREEEDLSVEAKVVGKTLGVHVSIPGMLSQNMGISEDANRRLGRVIFSISRVVLSTDADVDFYAMIAQDTATPEVELILIGAVDDFKRLNYENISMDEYFERRLTKITLTPQFERTRVIKELFTELGLQADWAEEFLSDYLEKKEAKTLDDIGYWEGDFFLKEIHINEFLAKQMEERIKTAFSQEDVLRDRFELKEVDVQYRTLGHQTGFACSLNTEDMIGDHAGLPGSDEVMLENTLKIIAHVIDGYKFKDFALVEVTENASGKRLVIDSTSLREFSNGKLGMHELMAVYRPIN